MITRSAERDGCVHLGEVLAAAGARRASLVPETSGYLALAIADAAGRLPFRIDDASVMLTTEGTVTLSRRGAPVNGPEAGQIARSILARLLAVSIGRMPGLSSAARPRQESELGVEGVARELEAALIPVNRAAARRALARLARETLKAKDSGVLGPIQEAQASIERVEPAPSRRRSRRPIAEPSPVVEASEAAIEKAIEDEVEALIEAHDETMFAGASEPEVRFEEVKDDEPSIEIRFELVEEPEASIPIDLQALQEPTPTAQGIGAVGLFGPEDLVAQLALHEPVDEPVMEANAQVDDAPTMIDPLVLPVAILDVGTEQELAERSNLGAAAPVEETQSVTATPPPAPLLAIELGSPLPHEMVETAKRTSWVDDPRSFDPPASEELLEDNDDEPTRRSPTPSMVHLLRRAAKAPPAPALPSSSRVDELLARFGQSSNDEASVRAAKASLKAFVGLDPTPPPPTATYTLPPGPVHVPAMIHREVEPTRTPSPVIHAKTRKRRNPFSALLKVFAALAVLAIVAALLVRYRQDLFALANDGPAPLSLETR